jgi:GDP-L-fucose synthase
VIFFKNKKILVAGGSGFFGSNITSKLIKLKSDVTASYFSTKKRGKYYKRFNFLNMNECLKATKKKDIVFLAVIKSSGIKNLENTFVNENLNNLNMLLNLIEACRINNVKKIIWISSSTIYQPLSKKISETQLNLNLDPYPVYHGVGWSYRYIEKVIWYYNLKFKMDIKILRTASIYGPYDNFNLEKSHVVPSLIKKTLDKNKIINVWGSKKTVRDFVFIDDLVQASLKFIQKSKINFPLNFSSGESTTIFNLTKIILKVANKNKKIKFIQSGKSSANFRVLDNSKINKILKNINRTKLETGLKVTIDWYEKNYK